MMEESLKILQLFQNRFSQHFFYSLSTLKYTKCGNFDSLNTLPLFVLYSFFTYFKFI